MNSLVFFIKNFFHPHILSSYVPSGLGAFPYLWLLTLIFIMALVYIHYMGELLLSDVISLIVVFEYICVVDEDLYDLT